MLLLAFAPLLQGWEELPSPAPSALHETWRWTTFHPEDGLAGADVSHLLDLGDQVWVVADERPYVYAGWSWRAVPCTPEWDGFVTSLTVARPGDLAGATRPEVWITAHGEAYRGDADGLVKVPLELRPDRMLAALFRTPDDALHALCFHVTAQTWELARVEDGVARPLALPGRAVRGFADTAGLTASGRLWAARDDGLYLSDGEGGWERRIASDGGDFLATVVRETAGGRGLAGVSRPAALAGLWLWSPDEPAHRVVSEGHGVVVAAAIRPNGDLLIAYESGLVRARHAGAWSDVAPVPEPLLGARELELRPNGDLWVAGGPGLSLFRAAPPAWRTWRAPGRHSPEDQVLALAGDAEGVVWAGTAGGVVAREPDGAPRAVPPLPAQAGAVTGIAIDARGRPCAVGRSARGVHVLVGGRWEAVTDDAAGRPLPAFRRIAESGADALWLLASPEVDADGTLRPGPVFRWRAGAPPEPWLARDALPAAEVNDLAVTAGDRVWCATDDGVWWLADGAWRRVETAPGGPELRFATAVVPAGASADGVWAATNLYLARITADGAATVVPLPPDVPGPIESIATGGNGRLWVGTHGAVVGATSSGELIQVGRDAGLGTVTLGPLLVLPDRVVAGSRGVGLRVLDLDREEDAPPRASLDPPVVEEGAIRLTWHVHTRWCTSAAVDVATQWRIDGGPWSRWSYERGARIADPAAGEHLLEVRARSMLGLVGPADARAVQIALPLLSDPRYLGPMLLLSGVTIALAVAAVLRRRRDARRLERSAAEQRLLMEEASDPILLFDVGRDRCRYANARAHELLGADVEARRASDLLGPAGAHFLRGVRDRALCELSLVGPAGEGIHVEASATRLEDGRVHAILRDLTVRRRLERERREFERKLTETQRLESLGLLAGGIAHDFNNLLMIVGGSADQALRSLPPDSPAAPALARIQTSVGRAGDLTTQLLAFAGRGTLRSEPVAMGPLVHEVVALAASNVSASTQIRAQVPPRLPDVQGDPTGLRQVVLNLILNAGDAVAADGGEVRVSLRIARTDDLVQSRSGWMQAPPAGRWIALEVADDGVGMDEQTQRRAFDPFFSTKAENRGLGLPAVRGIVHSLGGYLRLLSRPGGGTRFTILLPASSEAARDAAPEPAEPVLEEEPPRGGLVLVVDDEEGVRQVLHAMLGDLGFAVAEAASGRAALEIHRALGHTITCTLLDLSMPGWSGAETRRRIHALAPDAPVVLMSGFNDVAAPDEPGEAFLQKPFRRADVARLLDGLPSRALTDG